MVSGDPPGSVSDVLGARRALAAALKAPRWVQPVTVAGGAAAIAAVTGSGLTLLGLAAAVVIMLMTIYAPILVVVRGRRTLGVRLRRHRRTRRRLIFAWLVFVVFFATTYGLMWVLPLRTPLAYAVEFLVATVIYLVIESVYRNG